MAVQNSRGSGVSTIESEITPEKINHLRGSTENDWSWNCRRKFITYHIQHSPSYSLQVLDCFAWTLIYSKTLGCRYNADHMAVLNLLAAAADIENELLMGGPTPKIAPQNSSNRRGKGRGGSHQAQSSRDNLSSTSSLRPPAASNGHNVARNLFANGERSSGGGMNFTEFVAVLESIAPPRPTGSQPAPLRPFLGSSEDTNIALDKEVEELTSILEKNEKDKLLGADGHFDSSMLSIAAPSGGLLLRPSEAAADMKVIVSVRGSSDLSEHRSLLPVSLSQPPMLPPVSPELDDLELKRICDIVGPESAAPTGFAQDVTVKSVTEHRKQVGMVHASERTLILMKEKAPRNSFLAGLLSQVQTAIDSTQSPQSSSALSGDSGSQNEHSNRSLAADDGGNAESLKELIEPPSKNTSGLIHSCVPLGSRDNLSTIEILAFKDGPNVIHRDTVTPPVFQVSKYCRDPSPLMKNAFVVDAAFLDAVRFLKSRPANEIVVRLAGDLTLQESVRNLQETIDANRAGSLLAFHYQPPKSPESCHSYKFTYARTVIFSSEDASAKLAKNGIANKVLRALMQRFMTVKVVASESAFTQPVSREALLGGTATDLILNLVEQVVSGQETISRQSDFGWKILMKHGWRGKGLGKHESGSFQPIAYSTGMTTYSAYGKRGLGYKDEGIERALITDQSEKLFQCFLANAVMLKDLVFSNEFSAQEREIIHFAAEKYKLSHNSLGSGDNRHLVVRYKFNLHQVVSELRRVGGKAGRFELIEPSDVVEI